MNRPGLVPQDVSPLTATTFHFVLARLPFVRVGVHVHGHAGHGTVKLDRVVAQPALGRLYARLRPARTLRSAAR